MTMTLRILPTRHYFLSLSPLPLSQHLYIALLSLLLLSSHPTPTYGLTQTPPSPPPSPSPPSSSSSLYDDARTIRLTQGHETALPLYQSLLKRHHNDDIAAATRIAAGLSSPRRIASTLISAAAAAAAAATTADNCHPSCHDDAASLRELLIRCEYGNKRIQTLFGIRKATEGEMTNETATDNNDPYNRFEFSCGPVYARPVAAGDDCSRGFNLEISDNDEDGALKCLVALFLLGITVPRSTLQRALKCDESVILSLFERLGLAYPCEMDASMMVPYVHICPLSVVDDGNDEGDLFIVTDLHPRVLSLTALESDDGRMDDGPVMYIGPDSLALAQHFIKVHLSPLIQKMKFTSSSSSSPPPIRILDVCTGSGIQAIAALAIINRRLGYRAKAICVDVNERALRFVRFNALLNGMKLDGDDDDGDDAANTPTITTLSCDLLNGGQRRDLITRLDGDEACHIILANPPFVPVPPPRLSSSSLSSSSPDNILSKRYGLFSSGGGTGEDVLKVIISLSSRVLHPEGGVLAVVSEFMNPGSDLCDKILHWWTTTPNGDNDDQHDSSTTTTTGGGVVGTLFTNEHPLSSSSYAARRSHNRVEFPLWNDHLQRMGIAEVSPGLLFMRRRGRRSKETPTNGDEDSSDEEKVRLISCLVPRSEEGSVWTPGNRGAVAFTKRVWEKHGYN